MNRILMIVVLAAYIFNTGCQSHKKKKEAPTKFLVTSPLKTDTLIINEYVCQIQSIRHIELRAQERGYLQNVYVDEGRFVKEGQLLFKIMPRLYEAEKQKAEAEARVAEIEYLNTKSLADNNIVAPNELAMSKAKYDRAKAELVLAQTHLLFTEVRAPYSGYIDRFHVRLGSLLEEGDLLTTLSDNSKMWVYFNVSESEYLNYKSMGKKDSLMTVNLLMANGRQFEHAGIVETIEADFNNETGNIPFRATFPNPAGLLRHGETGSILVPVQYKNALIIPQKATFEILDKKYIYVVDKDNRVQQRLISVSAEMPDLFIVNEGLKEGEKILLEGLRKVKNDDKISYEYVEPRAVIKDLKLFTE